ncbi:hypothetical protein Shal_4054 [Shewanella halifaxensis HAW-EB4]|uniref:Uncharacterized protein n=1 Tax=Shewanella halifaxensis (strain HAW-EB4) TaxID=458817 RepID=B0TKK8_SHEHH|nr:hypothetical protein [Shewanella halifaxensis]ABZ78594.1 hypothetical protein Shal_4054 [Shewanella halifaxensis HAW-EB4]
MGVVYYFGIGSLAFVIIVILIMKNSFNAKCMKVAMKALEITIEPFDLSAGEYLPAPPTMKVMLLGFLSARDLKQILINVFDFSTPELGAYYMLDQLSEAFEAESKKEMAAWFGRARDRLTENFNKSVREMLMKS